MKVFQDFNGFMEDIPIMVDRELSLVCAEKVPEDPVKGWAPMYNFSIVVDGVTVGNVNLRIGYFGDLEFKGQIGYDVDVAHRGKGYAARGVKLLAPVAKFHKMEKLLITCNVDNLPSARVCEKLGLTLLRTTDVPEWHDCYKRGERRFKIYEWDLTNE